MREVIDALFAVYATGDLTRVDGLVAEAYVQQGKFFPECRAALKAEVMLWREVFSELRMEAAEVLVDGDRIAVRGQISGVHSGCKFGFPVFGLKPTGRPVRVPFHAVFRLRDGKIVERQQTVDWMAFVQQVHFPAPAPAPLEPRPCEILATFPTGVFLECVAFDGNGNAYISSMLHGDVFRRTPQGDIDTIVHIKLGLGDLLMCLVFDTEHSFYIGVLSTTPELAGIWHFDTRGKGRRVAPLSIHAEPNGIAMDENGCVYVADSALGTIWRLQPGAAQVEAWLTDELLSRRSVVGFVPGANGIQIWRQEIYVSNSDSGDVLRIPIGADGAAGTAAIYAATMGSDDMALDTEGTLYCTTHPANKVIAVTREGRRSVIASPDQGIIGPTYVAFGVGPADRDWMYVVTDGGLFAPLPGIPIRPSLARIHIGVPGEPCYWMRHSRR
jgi:sugar lactone lactonase YvrE/predicted ester cyclase